MTTNKSLFVAIPSGQQLTFTTDAYTSGNYKQVDNPGGTNAYANTLTTVNVSTTYNIGPFNGETNYLISYSGNDFTYTLTRDGAFTGTDQTAYALLASPVFTGTVQLPNSQINVTGYSGGSGQTALSKSAGVAKLTKSTAGSYTLTAPTSGTDDGLILICTSTTAAAHTITATSLVNDGATGVPHTTITFAAFAGASVVLMAIAGLWHVISNNNVTVS